MPHWNNRGWQVFQSTMPIKPMSIFDNALQKLQGGLSQVGQDMSALGGMYGNAIGSAYKPQKPPKTPIKPMLPKKKPLNLPQTMGLIQNNVNNEKNQIAQINQLSK